MNRVQHSIAIVREKFATLTAEQLASVDASLALDAGEHFDYQTVQARAHAAGELTTVEAQTIYQALGEYGSNSNGGWSADTNTATKYAVTLTIQALLERRVKAVA